MKRNKIFRREEKRRADFALLLVIAFACSTIKKRLPAVTGHHCCHRQALFCAQNAGLGEGGGG